MTSTASQSLRPGAGQHEIELFVTKTRDELDRTIDDLRERLDVKTRAKRVYASFRRDYDKNPKLFQSTGVGIVAVGVIMAAVAVAKRGRGG